MPRLLKTLLVLIVIAGAGYGVWRRIMADQPPPNPMMGMGPAPVSVAVVPARDVQMWNEFSGRLVAVDHADVRPRVTGVIEEVRFKDGAMVNKGDVLFVIDQRAYKAEADRAEGQLAAAKATAAAARREIGRADTLFKEKALSQKDYDTRRSGIDVADANVKIAEAAMEKARLDLDYTEVKAPISGRAGRAEITQGNLVEAGMGAAPILATIVSDAQVYADFDMDEPTFLHYVGAVAGDVTKIPVELGLATETGTPHTGHILSFDNRVNASSGTIRVRALFDNPDHALVSGLFARLLVGTAEKSHVLLVTDRAVGTDQSRKFVLAVGADGKTEYRPVRLGPAVDGLRVVEDGLKEGDKVIVSGLTPMLRPGMPVKPEMVAMDAKDAPPAEQAPAAGEKKDEKKPEPEKAAQ
jgi:multidrug efflux system membrane fusion protein